MRPMSDYNLELTREEAVTLCYDLGRQVIDPWKITKEARESYRAKLLVLGLIINSQS
jgi:hypothetical protein